MLKHSTGTESLRRFNILQYFKPTLVWPAMLFWHKAFGIVCTCMGCAIVCLGGGREEWVSGNDPSQQETLGIKEWKLKRITHFENGWTNENTYNAQICECPCTRISAIQLQQFSVSDISTQETECPAYSQRDVFTISPHLFFFLAFTQVYMPTQLSPSFKNTSFSVPNVWMMLIFESITALIKLKSTKQQNLNQLVSPSSGSRSSRERQTFC